MSRRVYTVQTDNDGWVTGATFREHAFESLSPGEIVLDESDHDLADQLLDMPPILHHDGTRLSIPHDDRRLWRKLRASTPLLGYEALAYRQRVRNLQTRLPDAPSAPTPSVMFQPVVDLLPVADYPDAPGLRMRPLTHDDLDLAAPLAVETGVYGSVCPDVENPCCNPPEAHAWCMLADRIDRPDTWQLTLEFDGRPLQFELIHLDPIHPTVTLTFHLTRERPHWFWRETEKPVFDALLARGHKTLWTRTRSDRPDWIAALTRNYGAREIKRLKTTTVLEFPLDRADTFKGWPARRTLSDWSVQQPGVTIREARPTEWSDMLDVLERRWGANPRKTLARRILREWVVLDRATAIVCEVNGVIEDIRLVRHRRDSVSSVAFATPMSDTQLTLGLAARDWQRALGFTKQTMFVPEWMLQNPRVQESIVASSTVTHWTQVATHTKFREPFVEFEDDLTL